MGKQLFLVKFVDLLLLVENLAFHIVLISSIRSQSDIMLYYWVTAN